LWYDFTMVVWAIDRIVESFMGRNGMGRRKGTTTYGQDVENYKSLSIRFNQKEWEMMNEIVERRNENSDPHCRVPKTRILKQLVINWIIDNRDNDTPFPEHPMCMTKHDI
jgi:hypothetical protein